MITWGELIPCIGYLPTEESGIFRSGESAGLSGQPDRVICFSSEPTLTRGRQGPYLRRSPVEVESPNMPKCPTLFIRHPVLMIAICFLGDEAFYRPVFFVDLIRFF